MGALYHVASEEPDSNERRLLGSSMSTEHGGARTNQNAKLYVAHMYVGGGRYWGHVRRNCLGMTDGHQRGKECCLVTLFPRKSSHRLSRYVDIREL